MTTNTTTTSANRTRPLSRVGRTGLVLVLVVAPVAVAVFIVAAVVTVAAAVISAVAAALVAPGFLTFIVIFSHICGHSRRDSATGHIAEQLRHQDTRTFPPFGATIFLATPAF